MGIDDNHNVATQRRRDPPAPITLCVRCGWSGTPPHAVLDDKHGNPSLLVSQKFCPHCRHQLIQTNEPKPSLPVEFVTAVREAKLTPDQLLELSNAARNAPPGMSPRQLADEVPAASTVITVAAMRGGDRWISFLMLAIAIISAYLGYAAIQQSEDAMDQAHEDAQEAIEQAHDDAQEAMDQAHEDAQEALREARSTESLSDGEIRDIARRIEAALEGDSASALP